MEVDTQNEISWHLSALPPKTKKALDFLSAQKWLEKSSWYLAGGTALALQAGHRKSVDLDFFTQERDFNDVTLLNHFAGNNDWKITINQEGTVYGELFGAKISFIAYPFFIPEGYAKYGSLKVIRSVDVAVMKIIAISQRGRKRDFFDLYWCAKNVEPLEITAKRLKKQYPAVAHDYHHILKSLVYFADAEDDPMPEIKFKANWSEVKKFFMREVPELAHKLLAP
ncbi:MAG: nucleotidyl transferase AbiEii/AbiGii toxin family protein [Candidatus Moranbacteria bacterium]|nr:nucleotidyl transferase AbiEii/AbiGii toxin family protein [Candidatus Moranbacteria bacterium]